MKNALLRISRRMFNRISQRCVISFNSAFGGEGFPSRSIPPTPAHVSDPWESAGSSHRLSPLRPAKIKRVLRMRRRVAEGTVQQGNAGEA